MPMDDVLKQAFGSAFATNNAQAFTGGMQMGNQIADSIIKADTQLQAHQMTIAMQQRELQQKYLEKGSDLMLNAGKDEVSGPNKTFLLNNASIMLQKAGLPGLSQGFVEAHRADPEFASLVTKALTMKREMDMDPSKRGMSAEYGQTLLQISQMDGADVTQWSRKLNEMTKDTTTIGSSIYRQGTQLQNSAILDRFKQGLTDASDIAKLRAVPGAYQKALVDPSTDKPYLDENGNPLTMGQASQRLAAVQMGTTAPTSADNQILQAFTAQAGSYKAQEQEFLAKEKEIVDARSAVAGLSMAGASKDLSKNVKTLLSAGVVTPKNVDQLAMIARQVQSGAVTQKDVTERNRTLDDKAVSVKDKILTNLSTYNQANATFMSKKNELARIISDPSSTTAIVNQKLREFAGTIDSTQRNTEPEMLRVLPITMWQEAANKMRSIVNDASGAPLTETQRNMLMNSLQSTGAAKSSSIVSYLYDEGKQLNLYGPEISPRLKDLKQNIESRISAYARDPSVGLVQGLYQRSNNPEILPRGSSEEAKHQWVINTLISEGYNPVKAENIFFMKKKAGK